MVILIKVLQIYNLYNISYKWMGLAIIKLHKMLQKMY